MSDAPQGSPYPPPPQYPAQPYPYEQPQYPAQPYPHEQPQYPPQPYPYEQPQYPPQPFTQGPGPHGYPQQNHPAAAGRPVRPSALPDGPREYTQLLRGPRHRWWKPLLSIPMFAATAFLLINLLSLLLIPIAILGGHTADLGTYVTGVLDVKKMGPVAFAFTNLSLIVLTPVAMFCVWAVHRTPPRFMLSVEGRFRWRWFGRCLLVLVPLWCIYLGVGMLQDPSGGEKSAHRFVLMIMVVLMTPLQAAGEEFAFRGFLGQVIGSWFRKPIVSALVPLPFSIGLFAMAHGSFHLWVLVDLGSFAAAAYLLMWRTGGLEANIALHAVNNVLLMLLTLTIGGFDSGFVESDTTGSWQSASISFVVNALVVVLLLWQAKRAKVRRVYQPPAAVEAAGSARTDPAYSPR